MRPYATDAALSPDGSTMVIRSGDVGTVYRAGRSVQVRFPSQKQGEAVTFTADSSALVLASEYSDALVKIPLR